ncbi:MAG: REP-associated tyrosine transposase [Candidatus Acidiferrales bacterium]
MARRHKSSEHPVHFISGDVRHRIPLFKIRPDFAGLFLDALCFYRREKGIRIFAYVVMPDHYHLLLGFPQELSVSDFLRDFKSYVGKQIVQKLRASGAVKLLERFRVSDSPRRRRDPTYGVLQPDNDDRVAHSERFFRQKLEYIHSNPWKEGLVERTVDYPWSSCRAYMTGEPHPIPIDSLD